MDRKQLKDSGILVASNLVINLTGFLKQIIMAWFLGMSADVDLLLLAMIVPTIIQAMIGGGAGEIMVIKRERAGFREGSFEAIYILSCLLPVALLGLGYYFSAGFFLPFFDISIENIDMFKGLMLIFVINMLPGTFNSILRPHLYSKGLYGFYAVSSIISQLAGILFILVTVKKLGIFSFAWGYLLTSTLNAVWFSFRSGLYLAGIFRPSVWIHEAEQLLILFKRVFSLSLQTLLNHFATFWERSLSVKYLAPGYLSSLNYSKTLTELPNTVLMSSVLTTSYIEQVKLHREDQQKFSDYTAKTLKLIISAGFLLQFIMLLLAPAIIILIYRRGRFDNDAVRSCLVIFNILTVGFLPHLIMNYFSRTMYILGEYKKLLLSVFLKVVLQIAIMVAFISVAGNAIPFAIVTGFMLTSVILFFFMRKYISLLSVCSFIGKLALVSIASVVLLFAHSYTINYYIDKTNLEIFLWSIPIVTLSGIITLIFLNKHGLLPETVKILIPQFWKSKNKSKNKS